jgi:hypothetical protein
MEVILLLTVLFVKHFVVDFPLQNSFQYLNKGKYLHFGGILHSGLHCITTGLIFLFYSDYFIVYAIVDFLLHYHIDWLKVNLNKKLGYSPTTHEEFWWLLGLDQLLHSLTYVAMVAVFIS